MGFLILTPVYHAMTQQLSLEQTRQLRQRAQRLHPAATAPAADVSQLVGVVGGLQAQELAAARLGVRARSNGLLLADVVRAREVERSIVLTWAMRGTLHLIATDDLEWLLPFFGPLFIEKTQRRYAQLGLDQRTRMSASEAMRTVLGERGPLTRAELAAALDERGIPVAGQAIHHLVRAAALTGVICFGPQRDGKLTLVPLVDWLGFEPQVAPDPEKALAQLARRYLAAFGPATPADFASWSGVNIRQARVGFAAIQGELLEVELNDTPAWMLSHMAAWLDAPIAEPSVRLLPRYDTFLLGYRGRAFIVPPEYARRIHPGGGIIKQSVIMDGRAIGTWRSINRKGHVIIAIEPFRPIASNIIPHLAAEVGAIGRFWGRETRLQIGAS